MALLISLVTILLAPQPAQALRMTLVDQPLRSPFLQQAPSPEELSAKPRPKLAVPSISGWIVVGAVPALLLSGVTVLGQWAMTLSSEGGVSSLTALGVWTGSNLVVTLLSSALLFGIARLAGGRPSFARMYGWSFALRMAGSLVGFFIFAAGGKGTGLFTLLTPLALGALAGTLSEVVHAHERLNVEPLAPPSRTPESGGGNIIYTQRGTSVPLLAFRF